MKRAADFRGIARKSLSGRWGLAIIAGLVASVLGACAQIGPDLNIESTKTGVKADIEFGTWTIPLKTWSFDQVAEFLARNAFYIATSVVAASAAFYREVSGTGIVTAEPVLENA